MRMCLTASIPVDRGNASIRDGSMMTHLQRFLETIKPEAAYFFADDDGNRSCFLVFDMQDTSEMTAVTEPFFQSLGARVSLRPVMNVQDLQNGRDGIERALNEYASPALMQMSP